MFSDFLSSAGKALGNAAKNAYGKAVDLSSDTMMYREKFENLPDKQLRLRTQNGPLAQRLAAAKVLSERSKTMINATP